MDSTELTTPSLQGRIKVTACGAVSCTKKSECIDRWFEIDKTKPLTKYEIDYKIWFITPWKNCFIWNSEDREWSYELEEDICKCPKAAKQKK